MRRFQAGLGLAAMMLTLGLARAEGDPAAGQQLVMQGDGKGGAPCLACHGVDGAGNDAAGFPRLAGLDAGYLARQLRDYRDGRRSDPIMLPNAANLSDQQIDDVAAYYQGQSAQPTPAGADDSVLALGEKLVKQGDWDNYIAPCESCHGPDSQGVGSTFPALAGQHAGYLRKQLEAWQSGARTNDENQLMLAIAGRLNPQQIEAVAAYLSHQSIKGAGQ